MRICICAVEYLLPAILHPVRASEQTIIFGWNLENYVYYS